MASRTPQEAEPLDPAPIELLAKAFAEWEAMVDSQFGKGTWQALGGGRRGSWNAVFLDNPRPPSDAPEEVQWFWQEQRDRELDILARGLAKRWWLQDPEMKLLSERAEQNGQSPEAEKLDLTRIGLLWASSEMRSPRTVRLGKQSWLPARRQKEWAVDHRGVAWLPLKVQGHPSKAVAYGRGKWFRDEEGQIPVEPRALPYPERLAWYVATAKKAARAALRDESWMTTSVLAENTIPLEDVLDVDMAVIEDAIFGDGPALDDILAVCDDLLPAEQELLDAYLDLGDWPAAGEYLGMKSTTMRKRKQRLMAKLATASG